MENLIENIRKNIAKEHAKICLITELRSTLERKETSLEWSKNYAENHSNNEYAKESYENELRDFEVFKETYEKALIAISNI